MPAHRNEGEPSLRVLLSSVSCGSAGGRSDQKWFPDVSRKAHREDLFGIFHYALHIL